MADILILLFIFAILPGIFALIILPFVLQAGKNSKKRDEAIREQERRAEEEKKQKEIAAIKQKLQETLDILYPEKISNWTFEPYDRIDFAIPSSNHEKYLVKLNFIDGTNDILKMSIEDDTEQKAQILASRNRDMEKQKVNFDGRTRELETYRTNILQAADDIEEIYKNMPSSLIDEGLMYTKENVDRIQCTNSETFEEYKRIYGLSEDNGVLAKKDFYLSWENTDRLYQISYCLMAAALATHETYEMIQYENTDQEVQGEYDFKYMGRFNKYSFPRPVDNKDIDILRRMQYQMTALARIVDHDSQMIEDAYSDYYSITKGCLGEKEINEYLDSAMDRSWGISNNVILPIIEAKNEREEEIREFECDSIVITGSKIYVLEVKNYGHGSLTISKDGIVTHRKRNEEAIRDRRNVIEQCEQHVMYLARLLDDEYGNGISRLICGVIVIANDSLEVDNQSDYRIVRKSLLRHLIIEDSALMPDNIDIERVRNIIEKNRRPEHKFDMYLYKPLLTEDMVNNIWAAICKVNYAVAERISQSKEPMIQKFDAYPGIEKIDENEFRFLTPEEDESYYVNLNNTFFPHNRYKVLEDNDYYKEEVYKRAIKRDRLDIDAGWSGLLQDYIENDHITEYSDIDDYKLSPDMSVWE